ncbi:MAG: acetyl-CoA carboxylase biotin carboxylase subunit [Armatimonadota bacterium]
MFSKVLVAGRGESAVRILRACRELGISTVAVYSQADRSALHVRLADEAVCIGPPPSRDSYLNMSNIIAAAMNTGAEAIHPGIGFLAENSSFAEACEACGIRFIGPSPAAMDAMGDKALARKIAAEAGLPTVPGSEGTVSDGMDALKIARGIGYPVAIKAAAGGGGKGIRIVHKEEDLPATLQTARSEASAAFGSPEVYIEKYIQSPRHVEVQILADEHGSVVHLGERDCSIQSRHQKLLEEGPSPALDDDLRSKITSAAVALAAKVGYTSAGTVEFLLDTDGSFYFMEMNTRVQVEHPVTEAITGIDIVKEQIAIASGQPLSFTQDQVRLNGHAIECRINASDPDKGFAPQSGTVNHLVLPGGFGVRVDTHLYPGYEVPCFYDSLLAKVITWGQDRSEAIARMRRSLMEFDTGDLRTTIPFHLKVLEHPVFIGGEVRVDFLARYFGMT